MTTTAISSNWIGTGELLARDDITITARQLHYWRTNAAIRPAAGGHDMGSGNRARWSPRDVARLRAIGRFVAAITVICPHGPALDTIRRIWDGLLFDDVYTLDLGDGIAITISIEGP